MDTALLPSLRRSRPREVADAPVRPDPSAVAPREPAGVREHCIGRGQVLHTVLRALVSARSAFRRGVGGRLHSRSGRPMPAPSTSRCTCPCPGGCPVCRCPGWIVSLLPSYDRYCVPARCTAVIASTTRRSRRSGAPGARPDDRDCPRGAHGRRRARLPLSGSSSPRQQPRHRHGGCFAPEGATSSSALA